MCGILGIWNLDKRAIDLGALHRATNAIRHRGPDDEGYLLVDTSSGRAVSCGGPDSDPKLSLPPLEQFRNDAFDLSLGFRRLSIQDLSPAGHQPMRSNDGRLWIVFNGEIYNYIELRTELIALGHQFRTGTDTEVILAAYQQWGEKSLLRFNGMWSFVIWDSAAGRLFAARDRFGEKPFHYAYVPGKTFAFASEMKALWIAGVVKKEVHEDTLALFSAYGQVEEGEQTFYENILRLPQAHYLTLSIDGRLKIGRYWDIDPTVITEGQSDKWYAEQFQGYLTDSIRIRLRADVPVGSSLSGGLDSSTVVAVINRILPANSVQKTFSARFEDSTRDEGKWMDLVTSTNRVDRHDVWPTAEQFFEELPKLFWHQEEPFTSTSVYAQWSVMRLAKENGVTVLLDGQGADESLAGYHSYFNEITDDLLNAWNIRGYLKWRSDCLALHGVVPGSVTRVIAQKVPHNVKRVIKKVAYYSQAESSVEPLRPVFPQEFSKLSSLRKLLWWNTTRVGLIELLRYADRNSMAHSREVRLPFLDHQLVEFIFQLPDRLLVRDGWTKWILREAFRGIVPAEISNRVDKLGYMPPQDRWLGKLDWREVMVDQLLHDGQQAGPLTQELASVSGL
jgi:asparagine synthase (glutamine-hydrolysing)